MKRFYVVIYIVVALCLAAVNMQSDAMNQGGYLGADNYTTFKYLFKALLWPLDLLFRKA